MTTFLAMLQEAGVLDALDVAFGEWIARYGGDDAGLAAALASAEVAKGHVCLDLHTAADMLRAQKITPPENWPGLLAANPAVAKPGGRAPLVLDDDHLYLHRYWRYETRIAETLRDLSAPPSKLDRPALKDALLQLFPHIGNGELDRQAMAAALGATRRLAIVSGGPGTGKTTTVLKLIALALMLDSALDIALAAPTGKAASRLGEVLVSGAANLPAAVRERLPTEPQTLHRLLGYNSARQTIRHDAANPLAADLIVVDEASMVDIGLMARLLTALKPGARLVLIGDRDQLASVEAGAVFGDICLVAGGFPAADAAMLDDLLDAPVPRAVGEVSPISACIALLKRNYRFGEQGIGALAHAVVAGETDAALRLLKNEIPSPRSREESSHSSPSPLAGEVNPFPRSPLAGEGWGEGNGGGATARALTWHPVADERRLNRELDRIVKTWFKPVSNASDPEEALALLSRFRLLAAERRGVFGVEGLNAQVENLLGVPGGDAWYQGRPVLITENDYELQLFNGDFGIAWPAQDGRLKLWIASAGGELRAISPARLPAHETAYALTVHKAQGSEFNRIALVLPPRESAVATRELVYTGITRAREGVEIWATEATLRMAINTPIRRASGLAARLSGSRPA